MRHGFTLKQLVFTCSIKALVAARDIISINYSLIAWFRLCPEFLSAVENNSVITAGRAMQL